MPKITNYTSLVRDFKNRYPKAFNAEVRNGVSRAATFLRRHSIEVLTRETSGQKTEFSSRIRVSKRPQPSSPTASVTFAYRPIPMRKFKPRTRSAAPSVYADINAKRGVGEEFIRKAWTPRGRRGANRVYERSIIGGRRVGRLPYRTAQGPGLALLFPPVRDSIELETEDFLVKTVDEGLRRRAARL